MVAVCISVEHYSGERSLVKTKGKSPGWENWVQGSELEVKVRLPDGSVVKASIKEHFKLYLNSLGRKKFSAKVIEAIRRAMPQKVNIASLGTPEFPCYQIDYADLQAWSANTII